MDTIEVTTVDRQKPAREEYDPTTAQKERAAALQRFNRLYIYAPVLLVTLIFVITIGLLLWWGLFSETGVSNETISGIADVIVILATFPFIIIGAACLVLIGLTYQEGRKRNMAPLKQTNYLLWQIQNKLGTLFAKIEEVMPKLAKPVIQAHGATSFVKTLINWIITPVKRIVHKLKRSLSNGRNGTKLEK